MGWYEATKVGVTGADQLRGADLKQKLVAIQVECANLAEENARLRQERNDDLALSAAPLSGALEEGHADRAADDGDPQPDEDEALTGGDAAAHGDVGA